MLLAILFYTLPLRSPGVNPLFFVCMRTNVNKSSLTLRLSFAWALDKIILELAELQKGQLV